LRILGLGDSFTYGAGASYEETYLRRLERLLQDSSEVPVEIIKAGIPRFFPEPERRLLETEGLRYEPNLVLVGFTPNDVIDTHLGLDAETVDSSGYLKTSEADAIGPIGTYLYLHSHAARLLLAGIIQRQQDIEWQETFKDNGIYENAWQAVEHEIGVMSKLSRDVGATLVVVHVPMSPFDTAYFKIKDRAYPGRRLARWAARSGVLFVDPLQAMIGAEIREPLYWPRDSHCNPAGYALIADSVYEALTDSKVLR
jgi:lysophospholipase L1-like esterase